MAFEISDELYALFRDLLLNRAGLHYPERKRSDLAYGLHHAAEARGYASIAEMYIESQAGGEAWDHLIAHLTIGETYFFRNTAQFDALRQHVFPEIIARRAGIHSLRIWSAGCATGEEPYSLAMLIQDMLGENESWSVTILATDINTDFLARAREGLYREWSFRETPLKMRERYFRREDSAWRLNPQIRRMVNFARLNLAEPSYPQVFNGTAALDVIVCRNVTIYFDEATTRQVAERFYGALAPGGWLIVGHAEPQASVYHQFEVINFPDTVFYRKSLNAPLFPVGSPALDDWRMSVEPLPQKRPLAAIPRSYTEPAPISAPLMPRPPAIQRPVPPPPLEVPPSAEQAGNLLKQARVRADQGDWAGAEEICGKALEADSLFVDAHYLLGQVYEHQGKFDEALSAYRRTTFLDQNYVMGTISMGNVWRQMNRTADAQRSYRNALRHLATLPADSRISGADGATSADLMAMVRHHLEGL